MSRHVNCGAWESHQWLPHENGVDRYCSKCGLLAERPSNRRDEPCHHSWDHLTFRRVCSRCGKVDRSTVLAPPKARPPEGHRSSRALAAVLRCWARDGPGCFYCGEVLAAEEVHLDHFVPASRGGPDGITNRRAACWGCDRAKADSYPWEFMPGRFAPPLPDDAGAGGVAADGAGG